MDFNPKFALVIAGAAFIVSLLLGLISGIVISLVLLRALLFAGVFFIISAAATVLIDKMLAAGASDGGHSDFDSESSRSGSRRAADGSLSDGAELPAGSLVDVYDGDTPQNPTQRFEMLDNETIPASEELPLPHTKTNTLYKNKESLYTSREEDSMQPGNSGEDGFSLNVGDFVPGMPEVSSAASNSVRKPEKTFDLGTVEMSVSRQSGKKIELSDLGDNVDGKKVAQAIQTLLKKDEG